MNNLILTGWSKSAYLAAAAAALEALGNDSDVAGVSMESLAGVLAGKALGYKAVYVLGVGLKKTNCNLPRLVREGKFRADLYQRVSTLVIEVPPLSARKEDIREIADSWWLDMCWVHLSDKQLDALCDYSYPGNVRELLNILDRARALEETDFEKLISEHKRINRDLFELSPGTVPAASVGTDPTTSAYPDNLTAATRQHVKSVFDKNNHNLTIAKTALGISVNTLKKYLA